MHRMKLDPERDRSIRDVHTKWMKRLVEEREAHVWTVRLDARSRPVEDLCACLSEEEIQRARSMSSALVRERFMVARAALRHVLATYAGTSPHDLALRREPGGKPALAAIPTLHFSLTHTGALAAIGLAGAPVGIDFEQVRALRRARAAARVLHPDTLATVHTLDPAMQPEALIDAWTLREAHVKAVGGGMFRTPDTVPWSTVPEAGVSRLSGRDGSAWSVLRWPPAPGLRAALAVRGAIDRVAHMSWDPETGTITEEG